MRILFLTSGAGGMYCGSCFRDNALAAALMARGHDVTLLPTYTPTRTDEPNVSDAQVFFGGVSVYLQQHVPLFRRTPWILDRVWDAPAVIRALTSRSMSVDPRFLGELTLSMLRGEQGPLRKEFAKLSDWAVTQEPFDVVSLPFALLIGLARPLKRALGRPVACTLQGEDLFLDGLLPEYHDQALRLIREQVGEVDRFLAVSAYYADHMSEALGIPRERIDVVPIGINLSGYAPVERRADAPFTLGYFARVAPEKTLDVLCEAYRLMRRERGLPPSRLEVAGYLLAHHRPYLTEIEARMRRWGLDGEFAYRGAPDRAGKIRFLQGLDVLSVPSRYVEPKGIYVLEAQACGVPVVQPRHGAFPELLARTGGGVLFEPGNVSSLSEAILGLAFDRPRARELGRRGAEAVRREFGVERMAERAEQALARVIPPRRMAAAV